jgi:hypothetical protein
MSKISNTTFATLSLKAIVSLPSWDEKKNITPNIASTATKRHQNKILQTFFFFTAIHSFE